MYEFFVFLLHIACCNDNINKKGKDFLFFQFRNVYFFVIFCYIHILQKSVERYYILCYSSDIVEKKNDLLKSIHFDKLIFSNRKSSFYSKISFLLHSIKHKISSFSFGFADI